MPVFEGREGRVIFLCPPASAGSSGGYALYQTGSVVNAGWNVLSYAAYSYNAQYGTVSDANRNSYAYASGMGDYTNGGFASTKRVVAPMRTSAAISHMKNEVEAWELFPIADIPADAVLDTITPRLCCRLVGADPTNLVYDWSEFDHDNPFLPTDLGLKDGPTIPALMTELTAVTDVSASQINARDAILRNFDLWVKAAYKSGDPAAASPAIYLAYFVLEVTWKAPTTIAIDGYEGVEMAGQMSLGASQIENVKNLAGTTGMGAALDGELNYNAAMSGIAAFQMVGSSDISKSFGGIDNTGWFTPEITFTGAMLRNRNIEGNAPMGATFSADLEVQGGMGGSLQASLVMAGDLTNSPILAVDYEGLLMSMTLSAAIGSKKSLSGTFPAALGLSGSMLQEGQCFGSLSTGGLFSGQIERRTPLTGGLAASQTLAAPGVERLVSLSGNFDVQFDGDGRLTYDLYTPALPENTITIPKRDRGINVPPKGRTIRVVGQQRN